MRRAIKRSSHRSENRESARKENPEILEPNHLEPAEAKLPGPEFAEPESVESESPAPKRSGPKPTKLPLWDFLEEDARDSDGTVTVLYRLEPVINRRHKEHFIAQKNGKLSRQDILQEFGSGVYDLYVKEVNKKLLYHEQLPLHHHKFPPQVNRAELVVGDPANAVYLEAWKKSADGDKSDRSPAASDMNTVLNTVLDKAGSFDPKLAELWETTALQRDELSKALAAKNAPPDFATQAKALKEVFPQLFQPVAASSPPASAQQLDPLALLKAMKDLQPDPPDPPDPLAVMERAQKLFAPQAATTDDFSRFEKFLSVADR